MSACLRRPAPTWSSSRPRADCRLTEPLRPGPDSASYDPRDPLAIRYDVLESDLLANGTVQRLLADRSILAVATRDLGGTPVQDLVAMWWSTRDRKLVRPPLLSSTTSISTVCGS